MGPVHCPLCSGVADCVGALGRTDTRGPLRCALTHRTPSRDAKGVEGGRERGECVPLHSRIWGALLIITNGHYRHYHPLHGLECINMSKTDY